MMDEHVTCPVCIEKFEKWQEACRAIKEGPREKWLIKAAREKWWLFRFHVEACLEHNATSIPVPPQEAEIIPIHQDRIVRERSQRYAQA